MANKYINPYGTGGGEASGVTTMRSVHIKMERGGLKNTGAMDYTHGSNGSFENYIRSAMLIKVNDATKVIGKTLTGFTVYEYSSSFAKIKTSSPGENFDTNTRYIKIVKQANDIVEDAILMFDGDVEEVYNVQIENGSSGGHLLSETLVFDVGEKVYTTARLLLPSGYSISGKKVPLIIWCACDGSYTNWGFYIDQVGSTPNVITSNLQYLSSQGFAVLNVYPWGSYNFQHFPSCGMSGAVPVPVTLRAYEKAVEYVTSRFNISNTNIFLTSWSGSGKLSAYYAIHKPTFNLRAIYAFSPVVDGGVWQMDENLGGANGMRGAENSEMHFDGTPEQITNIYLNGLNPGYENALAFKTLNAAKFAKCSSIQWQNLVGCYMKDGVLHQHTIEDKVKDSLDWGQTWRIETGYDQADGVTAGHRGNAAQCTYTQWSSFRGRIYNRYDLAITGDGAPITIIGAEDDCACPFMAMEQFIVQLQNGGNEAKLITLPNESSANGGVGTGHSAKYGHRAPIFYNSVVQYGGNNVGYGWWYAVQDIKSRFLKQQ